ncbi:uncharacterized protein MYCFIDRAFT_208916 [Pseudocercospora fijiensis CIRAD86]|uniref:Uncharacterized protein n=1 Tax=Pseudocercospora fijiensis (strain CIRAD86) TaxID=383855 RepID=M3ALF7_PSEFD|nr:uncharacterized protein MYCFIDRAFT_208916 [Pseudocercospora fijiensis CIRAD86]EME78252.1 hypothetical protein MYCFIDRAFT_208916 [Pseudocercospora fijiensis CIRAD86]
MAQLRALILRKNFPPAYGRSQSYRPRRKRSHQRNFYAPRPTYPITRYKTSYTNLQNATPLPVLQKPTGTYSRFAARKQAPSTTYLFLEEAMQIESTLRTLRAQNLHSNALIQYTRRSKSQIFKKRKIIRNSAAGKCEHGKLCSLKTNMHWAPLQTPPTPTWQHRDLYQDGT